MAKKGSQSAILLIIACAALYIPFHQFIQSRGYESTEEFFQDVVLVLIIAGIIILPILALYRLTREPKKKKKPESGEPKAS